MHRSQSIPVAKKANTRYTEDVPHDGILLVVGDGNMTFSERLAVHAKDKATVFCTTYHSLEELQELYQDKIDQTIERITKTGSKVLHRVDAMNLGETFGSGTGWNSTITTF